MDFFFEWRFYQIGVYGRDCLKDNFIVNAIVSSNRTLNWSALRKFSNYFWS